MDRRLKKADRFGFELPRSALCEKPMISKKSQFYVRRSGVRNKRYGSASGTKSGTQTI
jgi:hypothetical protein